MNVSNIYSAIFGYTYIIFSIVIICFILGSIINFICTFGDYINNIFLEILLTCLFIVFLLPGAFFISIYGLISLFKCVSINVLSILGYFL